jgi:hypothetical protein
VLERSSRPPWVVTVRRTRGVTLRRRIVHRVVLDDPDSAAALTARLDRELSSPPDSSPRHIAHPGMDSGWQEAL